MLYLKAKDNSGYLLYEINTNKLTVIDISDKDSYIKSVTPKEFLSFMDYRLENYEILDDVPKAVKVLYGS